MLTIQNIDKIIGSKLDKKNYVVKHVYAHTEQFKGSESFHYVFKLENPDGNIVTVRLNRTLTENKMYKIPHYVLQCENGNTTGLTIEAIKNRDQLIDYLRYVAIK